MQSKGSLFFKVLINRLHAGKGESFLKFLPKEKSREILSQATGSSDALPLLTLSKDQIKHTHYSWLAPVMQQMPETVQRLVISSLPSHQATRLSGILKLPIEEISLAEPVKEHFLTLLWRQWNPKAQLPLSYLPATPLLGLIEMNKNELVEVIDFLALYDLAEAIRHIVDKNYLKKIYQALSPKKQQFLRLCLHQKEKVSSPKLELNKWTGEPQKLESVLHRRGLFRFGKALSGQNPDFQWYVIHKLDIGRGTILSKYFSAEVPGITPLLVQQVLFVMNFLKKKG